jgi:hypothetical protein
MAVHVRSQLLGPMLLRLLLGEDRLCRQSLLHLLLLLLMVLLLVWLPLCRLWLLMKGVWGEEVDVSEVGQEGVPGWRLVLSVHPESFSQPPLQTAFLYRHHRLGSH